MKTKTREGEVNDIAVSKSALRTSLFALCAPLGKRGAK